VSAIFNDKVLHNLMSLALVMGLKRTLAGHCICVWLSSIAMTMPMALAKAEEK